MVKDDENLWALDMEVQEWSMFNELGSCVCAKAAGKVDNCEPFLVGLYNGKTYYGLEPSDSSDMQLLRAILGNPDNNICIHNSQYDVSWLVIGMGIEIKAHLHDTMTRMSFINEYADLSLDACCKYFQLSVQKDVELYKWCYDRGLIKAPTARALWDKAGELWKQSEGFRQRCTDYNYMDCVTCRALALAQEPYMPTDTLMYDTECALILPTVYMKQRGIKFDIAKCDAFRDEVAQHYDELLSEIRETFGVENPASTQQVGAFMARYDTASPLRTAKGGDSWSANALERLSMDMTKPKPVLEFCSILNEYRKLKTLMSTTLPKFHKFLIDGRLHPTFYATRNARYGTVSGRFSSAEPNLQNVPARNYKNGIPTYGDKIRSFFLPDDDCKMVVFDYSQIEYVVFTMWIPGAWGERMRAWINGGRDFHKIAMEITGINDRSIVKNINYGKLYFMGLNKLMQQNYVLFSKIAEQHNETLVDYVTAVAKRYNTQLPCIGDTAKMLLRRAQQVGYLTSLGGRRHHIPPVENGIRRDYAVVNHLIQGSASDIMKVAMYNAWKSGVFDTLHSHLTVHDELVSSMPQTREGVEAAMELQNCMETALKERRTVNIKAEGGFGDTWADKENEDGWKQLKESYMNGGLTF